MKLGVVSLRSMPFPKRLLNDYESMVLDLHPHWWFYGAQALSVFGSLVLASFVLGKTSGGLQTVLQYPLFFLVLVLAAWLIVTVIKWRTTYFVVTSHRLIYRQGVVARGGIEIPLEKVNNVNFEQGILERLIGVGTLVIESGGKDGQQKFSDISQPESVQNIIHSTMQNLNTSNATFTSAPSVRSVASEIEKLEALRDRGTLTDEEFEAQKRRLLG
jgi:uncharacterized membrane protein YdbT with pleckstrin-like domain